MEVEDTDTVNILFSGYVGKDPDGFDLSYSLLMSILLGE